MHIRKSAPFTYHITSEDPHHSMLYRYGILRPDDNLPLCADDGVAEKDGILTLDTKIRTVHFGIIPHTRGFRIEIPLADTERLFGLGDATRREMMVRGICTTMDIANVTSYGPMPILLSDNGWAFFLNTTYRSIFDCAKTDPGKVVIEVENGYADLYLFTADSLKELLGLITYVTGRPALLPKFAYGLTLVQNEETDARSMLWDIRTLRDRDIPCDTMGLEPSWMEKRYDFSVSKEWNKTKFPLPSWYEKNSADSFTFFFPMREMGMQLSLWLCNDYDLLYEEDRKLAEKEAQLQEHTEKPSNTTDAVIFDAHFSDAKRMDELTDPNTPWFENLKKFVDNGAAAFKLDGANQIIPHPDRLWGGKYTDDEVHNLYPVLLARQIQNGFSDYTGRRLLLYTSGAYIGTQQYAATWAGDTGGGPDTLVSLMNYAMCGHSNTACDIDVPSPYSIHYGFLTPWSQYFCWSNWKYPWFLRPEEEEMIRFYARLRSSLFPYLYTMAHRAYETGIPMLRPLPLMYEDTDRFDHVKNAYMLGDNFYVGVFDMHLILPPGRWIDYFTGIVYEGEIDYDIPCGRGGALFIRAGSVIVTMEPQKYILEKAHEYRIEVFPGGNSTFQLYEDDGFTYDYQSGKYALTDITLCENTDGAVLTVHKRTGGYPGREDNGHDILHNSIPHIPTMDTVHDITVILHGNAPCAVTLCGKPVDFTAAEGMVQWILPAAIHASGDAVYNIQYEIPKERNPKE